MVRVGWAVGGRDMGSLDSWEEPWNRPCSVHCPFSQTVSLSAEWVKVREGLQDVHEVFGKELGVPRAVTPEPLSSSPVAWMPQVSAALAACTQEVPLPGADTFHAPVLTVLR